MPLVAKGCTFNQKFTCSHCGSRQTMAEQNKLFTSGTCEACGKVTQITKCNYMLAGPGDVMLDVLAGPRQSDA